MHVRPVTGIPEVRPGDDIGTMLDAIDPPDADDVVVVASTIVSKAEDRGRTLDAYIPGERARSIAERLSERSGEQKDPRFAQAVIEESSELLMEEPFLLAVTRFGHIGVNAGIDRTNITDGSDILLLPT
ncbi:MAG: coenzyme F420-0:L-glutamate ligase, partial [Halobacteriota archaeon]